MSFPSASDMKGTSCKHGSQLVRPFMWLLRCQVIPVTPQAQVRLNLFLLLLCLSFKSLDLNALELSVTLLACFPQKWAYHPAWPVRGLALQPKWLSQRINRSKSSEPGLPQHFTQIINKAFSLALKLGEKKRMESATTRDCYWGRLESTSLKSEPALLERKSERRWLGPSGFSRSHRGCPLSFPTVWATKSPLPLTLSGAAWRHQWCKLKQSRGVSGNSDSSWYGSLEFRCG